MSPPSLSALARLALALLGVGITVSAIALSLAEGRSETARDQPAPGPVTAKRGPQQTVWAVGDGADGSSDAKAVANRIENGNPDRFLYLGDVYDNGTAREFDVNYAPVYGRFDEIAAPTSGNHDWGNRSAGYSPYFRQATGERMPPWYAFNLGGWQLLSLNSEAPHGLGSRQLDWLRQKLRNTKEKGTCRIAFWHRPRFSAGDHGDAPDTDPFWRALHGSARIVLNGHDHSMQRLERRRGIVEFVAGSGGHSPTSVDQGDPRLEFADDSADGALRLRLEPESVAFAFVSVGGATLDSGTVGCQRAG